MTPDQLQPWVRLTLKPRGRYLEKPHPAPSEQDTKLTLAALAGVEPAEIEKRFGSKMAETLEALRRVRDAARRKELPQEIRTEHPWLEAWVVGGEKARKLPKSPKPKPSGNGNGAAPKQPAIEVAPLTGREEHAIALITDKPYQPLSLDNPDALPAFLAEAKARFAVATGPLALRRLSECVAAGHPRAITEAREFLYGSSRGPMFAQQINVGMESGRQRSSDSFADVILQYEKEHPEQSGESTVFDEGVLDVEASEEEDDE